MIWAWMNIFPSRSALRRTGKSAQENEVLDVGGIHLDKAAHMVEIDGRSVDLSYKEFELLTYFMENRGIALSREKILNNVWNYDYLEMQELSTLMLRSFAASLEKRVNTLRQSGEWATNSR